MAELTKAVGKFCLALYKKEPTPNTKVPIRPMSNGPFSGLEAERDAKFTVAQIRAMSAGPIVGLNAEGNVQVDISFIHSRNRVTARNLLLAEWP